jgi:hypothetical protein
MIFIPESLQISRFPSHPHSLKNFFWHLGPLRIRMLLLGRLQGIDEMLDG